MEPTIAVSNIFGQDAERVADFARLNGFAGIDWSIDQHQSAETFFSRMEQLNGLEIRFHCPFHGVDIGYADQRADTSLAFLTAIMERIALVGGRHMTVHTGFGRVSEKELDFNTAVTNLRTLVLRGAAAGVAVSLENLTSHWTSDPGLFRELIEQSGAGVTLDLGHAHVCSLRDPESTLFEHYLMPHRDKIVSAHIYHTEEAGVGHLPPRGIEDLFDRLELLRGAPACTWWVIELNQMSAVLHTRDVIDRYFNTSFSTPFSLKEAVKSPQHV